MTPTLELTPPPADEHWKEVLCPLHEMTAERVDEIELAVGALPGVDTPVKHIFTPGLYAREIFMPRGAIVVSKIHKTEHPYVISKGRVSVWTEADGILKLEAPFTGVTKPGTRRVLYIHKNTVWTTFHAGDETNVDDIEERIIEKRVPVLKEGV